MSKLTFEISATAASSFQNHRNLFVEEVCGNLFVGELRKRPASNQKWSSAITWTGFVEANRILSNEGVEFLNFDLVASKDSEEEGQFAVAQSFHWGRYQGVMT